MNFTSKKIAQNACIAALYVVLTLIAYPISFLGIQFRFAEILILLCFFRKDFVLGLTLGCLIANVASFNPIDILLGTLATLLSCLCICFSKHLIVSLIFPVVFNGFIIGFELYQFLAADFWISVISVALGELAVMTVGYVLIRIFSKRNNFHKFINSTQNQNYHI